MLGRRKTIGLGIEEANTRDSVLLPNGMDLELAVGRLDFSTRFADWVAPGKQNTLS